MKTRIGLFNIYLMALCCAIFLACETTGSKKKDLATLSLHREVNPDGTGKSESVLIHRADPQIFMNIEKEPFLLVADIIKAEIVDQMGSFAIRVQFNNRGVKMLEAVSLYNMGRHYAILCAFPEKRWLAAPLFSTPIRSGSITFTPDASREEADRIVNGINAMAKKISKKSF